MTATSKEGAAVAFEAENSGRTNADDILHRLEIGQQQLSKKIDLQLQKLDNLLQQEEMNKPQPCPLAAMTPYINVPCEAERRSSDHRTCTPEPDTARAVTPFYVERERVETRKVLKAYQSAMGWSKTFPDMFNVDEHADLITRFASGPCWAYTCIAVIIASTIVVSIETQLSTSHAVNQALSMEGNEAQPTAQPTDFDDTTFRYCEVAFICWMTLEVLLNAYAQKWDFFVGRDSRWNAFDIVVVVIMVLTQIMQFASASFLRLTRVARLIRMGKILRVFRIIKFLRTIRSMMISITGSTLHLLSALLVMCIFMFVVSVIIMQGISHEIHRVPVESSSGVGSSETVFGFSREQTDIEEIATFYGDFPKTMMTLFLTVSGGLEWRDAARPLVQLGPYYAFIWTAYIAFMVFGLLNVLTGIFVDTAMNTMNNDRDNIIQSHLDERQGLFRTMASVFTDSDTDGTGQITESDMHRILKNPQSISYFNALGVDVTEAMGLFQLLDDDDSGTVALDEFITGFLRLKGNAKAVDMVTMMYQHRKISKLVKISLYEAWDLRKAVFALQRDVATLLKETRRTSL